VPGRGDGRGEAAQLRGGDGREEVALVGEVLVGGVVGDPGAASDLAEGDGGAAPPDYTGPRPALADGGYIRRTETVVVAVFREEFLAWVRRPDLALGDLVKPDDGMAAVSGTEDVRGEQPPVGERAGYRRRVAAGLRRTGHGYSQPYLSQAGRGRKRPSRMQAVRMQGQGARGSTASGREAKGMGEHFDAVAVGAGPGGEVVAGRLLGSGRSVALVERELIGGECAYRARIPSKTLLRSAEAAERIRVPAMAVRLGIGIDDLRDQIAPFPTYSEGFHAALSKLELD
jgi:hypothetical protein